MQCEQVTWHPERGWSQANPLDSELVFVFGSKTRLQSFQHDLRHLFPNAFFFGCSSAGEIAGNCFLDESIVATGVAFKGSQFHTASVLCQTPTKSYEAGKELARSLSHHDLKHFFLLSDGIRVNGSEVIRGVSEHLPTGVPISGGLAGDGTRFKETLLMYGTELTSGHIIGLGVYGKDIKTTSASFGGWDSFGPERLITRSSGNVLYELDGKPALQLYRTYLGEFASSLPSSGLLFPLSLRSQHNPKGIVRTILSIDESSGSLIFAGDVPKGSYARLMTANLDRLIDGAVNAAKISLTPLQMETSQPGLAILISCVGRRMVLRHRVAEEIEGVVDVIGNKTTVTGFYSYGEISPYTPDGTCDLHNQTMTITTFTEFC